MKNHRVMIVEDESLVAEDLHMCLERFGYEVVGIADTAEGARRLARETAPDLALLDIRLKGTHDGIDVAEQLRRDNVGFVYLTSHADQATLSRAQATEPLGYVLKPFDSRQIHPVLEMAFYRHEAEVKLRSMERWLATTLRSIGDGVLVTDLERRITYLNPVAERTTGWSLREALGVPFETVLRLVRPGQPDPIPCIVARAIRDEATIHLEPGVELLARDGRRVPLDDCAAPIRGDDGLVVGAVVVFRDATEKNLVLEQQRQADRQIEEGKRLQSLGVLAGGLAHDLNNVLTAILGNVSLCRDAVAADGQQPLDAIESHVRTAAGLCRQMLAGAGGGPLAVGAVDVEQALRVAVQREQALAAPNLLLSLQCDARPVRVAADPVQFGQVVANLLRNAVEALAGRSGEITVRAGAIRLPGTWLPDARLGRELPPGDYVWIEVADDGPGMPADVRARIFEPFFTTKFTGRGLGLASVHGIVRRHGGGIYVESEAGQGTVFRVLWPAAADPGGTQPPPAEGVGEGSFLLVDDDASVRRITAELLRARGCQCHEFASGDELLEGLRAGVRADAVILDEMMPGRTGQETLAELRQTWPELPVLLVSGHVGRSDILLVNDPHLDFLAKPFAVEELLASLQRLLRVGG